MDDVRIEEGDSGRELEVRDFFVNEVWISVSYVQYYPVC